MDLEDLNWINFTVTCPGCGQKRPVHLTVYEQPHRGGEFSLLTNRFVKYCSRCEYGH